MDGIIYCIFPFLPNLFSSLLYLYLYLFSTTKKTKRDERFRRVPPTCDPHANPSSFSLQAMSYVRSTFVQPRSSVGRLILGPIPPFEPESISNSKTRPARAVMLASFPLFFTSPAELRVIRICYTPGRHRRPCCRGEDSAPGFTSCSSPPPKPRTPCSVPRRTVVFPRHRARRPRAP